MRLSMINESGPQFKTLKGNTVDLSDAERQQVMDAKAVWHHGKDGAPTPAVKKAEIRGKTYYYSYTHRHFRSATTLAKAIKDWHDYVEPSS